MPGLFSDMRRTMAGAGGLAFLALLFAEPGGVGGSAVKQDNPVAPAETKAAKPLALASVRPDRAGWNAAPAEEPSLAPPAAPGAISADAQAAPRPLGPDNPPGLPPSRYSSSAAVP